MIYERSSQKTPYPFTDRGWNKHEKRLAALVGSGLFNRDRVAGGEMVVTRENSAVLDELHLLRGSQHIADGRGVGGVDALVGIDGDFAGGPELELSGHGTLYLVLLRIYSDVE